MALDSDDALDYAKVALSLAVTVGSIAGRLALVALRVGVRVAAIVVPVVAAALTDEQRQRRARRWLLLTGDRWHVVGGLTLGLWLMTVALGVSGLIGVRESGFVTTMFSTIIAGLFSFVPIVVAVNQLTITRLFGTPASLRERVEDVTAFRETVEAAAGTADERADRGPVAPTDPAAFLALVAAGLREHAAALRDADAEAARELAADALADAEDLRDALAERDARLFDVLVPMLGDPYSRRQADARRVAATADLDADAAAHLDSLRELLVATDVVRQYYKVLYLQDELAGLSRWLAYGGIGSFVTSTLVIMLYASGYPPAVGGTTLLLVVSFGLTAAFFPFAVLFAYVLRVATIVQLTASPGSFTPRGEREQSRRVALHAEADP